MTGYYSMRGILKQTVPVLLVVLLFQLLGGHVLSAQEARWEAGILVMMPLLNGMGGNLGSILGSRMSSKLHTGEVDLDGSAANRKVWRDELLQVLVLGWITFAITAVALGILFPLIGQPLAFWKIIVILIVAGTILTLVVGALAIGAAFVAFRLGLDPDNAVAPVVTTGGDLTGILALALAVLIVI